MGHICNNIKAQKKAKKEIAISRSEEKVDSWVIGDKSSRVLWSLKFETEQKVNAAFWEVLSRRFGRRVVAREQRLVACLLSCFFAVLVFGRFAEV